MPSTDSPSGTAPSRVQGQVDFDTTVAHPARVYDYWLGGKDNFAADRAAGDEAIATFPGIVAAVRANRDFLVRAVRYLVAEAGIRQFLDIGTGIPTANNTHEVAQRLDPGARIVYVDNDPIVLAHARALLTSTAEGSTAYIAADVRDTADILAAARETLDFGQPVAIMLLGILQLIPDADDPWEIVAQLKAAVSAGSHLVISHPAKDILTAEQGDIAAKLSQRMPAGVVLRGRADVLRLFAGFTLAPPGLVPLDQWRPDLGDGTIVRSTAHGGVASKP